MNGALDIFRGTMVSENISLDTVIIILAFTKGKGKRKYIAAFLHGFHRFYVSLQLN